MDGKKQRLLCRPLIRPIEIKGFDFKEIAPLRDNMPQPREDAEIRTMEEYDQGFGSILYSTTLPELRTEALLTVNDPHAISRRFSWRGDRQT